MERQYSYSKVAVFISWNGSIRIAKWQYSYRGMAIFALWNGGNRIVEWWQLNLEMAEIVSWNGGNFIAERREFKYWREISQLLQMLLVQTVF